MSDENFDDAIDRDLEADDPLVGFEAWSDTELDEMIDEVKRELDDDFDAGP